MMETITVEFMDPDFLKIKDEDMYDEAESPCHSDNDRNRTKCGEIFTTKSKEFLLICSYCHNIYYSMITFGLHVLEKHTGSQNISETVTTANFEYIEQVDCLSSDNFETEDVKPDDFDSNKAEINETLLDTLESNEDDSTGNFALTEFSWYGTDEQSSQDSTAKLLPNPTTLEAECSSSDLLKKKKRIRKKYISKSNPFRSNAKKVSPDEVQNIDLYCEHCSREYGSKSYFRRHAMQHENLPNAIRRDPDWLKCISCSIESKTREEWLTHEKTHKGRSKCRKNYISKSNRLRSGAKKVSPDEVHNSDLFCEHCNRQYANSWYFRRHAMQHENLPNAIRRDPDWLKCISCSIESKTREEWLTHEKTHKGRSKCRKNYISKSNRLRSGAKKVSPDEVHNSDLFCEHCNRQYANSSYFRRHAMQHENLPNAIRRDPDWLKCICCSVESKTREEWLVHEKTHAGRRPRGHYQCSFCPKMCQTATGVEEHMNIHRGLKPFKCDQCPLGFASYLNLQRHVRRIHLGERSHNCEECDRKFFSMNEKQEHILRAHKKEKPIQCEVCGKKFVKNATMNMHMKTHLTRDVKCPHCPKTFFHSKQLRLHMAKHSTARPYVCRTCGNAFSRRNSLKAHVLLHEEIKKYVCKICDRGFAQAAGLYSHMKTHSVAS